MSQAYEANLSSLYNDVARVVAKLRERNKLPDDFCARRLSLVFERDVYSLHSDLFDDTFETFRARLRSGDSCGIRYCLDTSVVLIRNKNVIGTAIFLPPEDSDSILLFALVVRKKFRKSWVTPVLKMAAFEAAIDVGAKTLIFHAFLGNKDTVRNATRAGAQRAPALD